MENKFKFRNVSPFEFFYFGLGLIGFSLLFKMENIGPVPILLILASIFELFFRKQKRIPSNLLSLLCAGVVCFMLFLCIKFYVIDAVIMKTDAMESKISKGAKVYYTPFRSPMFKVNRGDLIVYNNVSNRKNYIGELKNFTDKENCEVFRINANETINIPVTQIKGKVISIRKKGV